MRTLNLRAALRAIGADQRYLRSTMSGESVVQLIKLQYNIRNSLSRDQRVKELLYLCKESKSLWMVVQLRFERSFYDSNSRRDVLRFGCQIPDRTSACRIVSSET